MSEWFKEWFSSSEYLQIYNHRDDNDAAQLCGLIREHVPLGKDTRLMDFACGSGRHANIFASFGCSVFAFDLSRNLLNIARKKTSMLGLNVNYFCSDIRRPAFRCSSFDVATNLFTSFGYFQKPEENFAIFDKAFACLKIGGYFVFDYMNPVYLTSSLKSETIGNNGGKMVIQRRRIQDGRVIKSIVIKDNVQERSYTESVALYEKECIVSEFEKRGFAVTHLFGDYMKSEFVECSSPRIIIIARKLHT